MTIEETYMTRCINLAKKGMGNTSPNPMVGAVIVHNNKIIGEGYHRKYGEAHAEVNAINAVKDQELLKHSTIYVSLEPCAHYGKTPPCSDLIIDKQIPKVVIGCIDPFASVAGKGIARLKKAGTEVTEGIQEEQCLNLNKTFFTFHTKKRPYILLKWARTQDGFIDQLRTASDPTINWITQPETQQLTHKWRTECDAILIGTQTAINDNPSLTARAYSGKSPIRLVLDRNLIIDANAKVFSSDVKTVIFNTSKTETVGNINYHKIIDWNNTNNEVLTYCYKNDIQSVLIEGGKRTLQTFIDLNIWDEAMELIGTSSYKKGLNAPIINEIPQKSTFFGKDNIKHFIND